MVCSFMLIVLPAVLMRVAYWFYGLITGKKQEPAAKPAPATNADGTEVAKKGTCPYHVVMNFLGFKVPEKKKPEEANASATVKTTEDSTNQLKTD